MKNKKKYIGFNLVNNEQMNEIKGGVNEEGWSACAPLIGDIHSCMSFEAKCPSGFTYTNCATLESAKCPSNFTVTQV